MQSQRLADLLRATLDEQGLFLGQLSRVFNNRGAILTRPDFRDLVQELLRRFPTIQAVEWAPRVPLDERAAFETAQQADVPGFAIRERETLRVNCDWRVIGANSILSHTSNRSAGMRRQ
jgi:hypothetical protein